MISFVWDELTLSQFESVLCRARCPEPPHFDTLQVYFQFVETDRGTPNAPSVKLDFGFKKSLIFFFFFFFFFARSEPTSTISPSLRGWRIKTKCFCKRLQYKCLISGSIGTNDENRRNFTNCYFKDDSVWFNLSKWNKLMNFSCQTHLGVL